MTDLSQLAKDLQAQVDVITKYLEKEKLPSPSFIPSGNPMTVPMSSLPPEIEKARAKAHSLSWNMATLITPPVSQIMMNTFSVHFNDSLKSNANVVLCNCLYTLGSREENRTCDPH